MISTYVLFDLENQPPSTRLAYIDKSFSVTCQEGLKSMTHLAINALVACCNSTVYLHPVNLWTASGPVIVTRCNAYPSEFHKLIGRRPCLSRAPAALESWRRRYAYTSACPCIHDALVTSIAVNMFDAALITRPDGTEGS